VDALADIPLLLTVWVAVLGLVVGSFLNVVVVRVPRGESIVRPRSKCPQCGHELAFFENIPVFSWLFLRGRCRACQAPISVRYVVLELLTSALFLACFVRHGWTYALWPSLVFVSLLLALIFIDAEHWLLPFEITLPGIALGVGLAWPLGASAVQGALWGATLGFLAFRLIEYLGWLAFRKEAMGGGDKFLFAMVGAFLTHRALMGVLLLSSIQGAVFGLTRLALTGRAGPGASTEQPLSGESTAPGQEVENMPWAFLAPGLSWWRRCLAIPYAIFLQPIPDVPMEASSVETLQEEWTPGETHLPFGPWIAVAGIELLLFGPWLSGHFPLLRQAGFILGGM